MHKEISLLLDDTTSNYSTLIVYGSLLLQPHTVTSLSPIHCKYLMESRLIKMSADKNENAAIDSSKRLFQIRWW